MAAYIGASQIETSHERPFRAFIPRDREHIDPVSVPLVPLSVYHGSGLCCNNEKGISPIYS